MELTDIKTVKALLEKHGAAIKKTLGQNFLVNREIPVKIAEASGKYGDISIDEVLEIGPGIGALTSCLAQKYKKTAAVEIDETLIPVHNEIFGEYPNISVIYADFLKLDTDTFIKEHFHGNKINVCANLPYYITTPIIIKLLESKKFINSITIMVQKEVADRLCASVKEKNDYGSISLFVKYHCETKKLFNVPPGSFLPQPKVTSSVINLKVREIPAVLVEDEELLFKIIRASFGQRRKTLVNSLSSAFSDIKKIDIADIIKRTTGNENVRGEELPLETFAVICDEFKDLQRRIY